MPKVDFKKYNAAFTLIEVIIALALFSVSILMLSQSFINGLICKRAMTQDNPKYLVLDVIRYTLSQIKKDQVASSHTFTFPECAESVRWQGKWNATAYLGLYKVDVTIQGDPVRYEFWIRRKDWITHMERLQSNQMIKSKLQVENT